MERPFLLGYLSVGRTNLVFVIGSLAINSLKPQPHKSLYSNLYLHIPNTIHDVSVHRIMLFPVANILTAFATSAGI